MNKNIALVALGTLEGFKVKFKELHWAASTMAEHKLADEILSSIIEFQDELAEESFGLYGQPELGDLVPTTVFSGSVTEGLTDLKGTLMETRKVCEEQPGILAIVDSYIHDVNKFIYLSNLL